jgi:hypothetical protein
MDENPVLGRDAPRCSGLTVERGEVLHPGCTDLVLCSDLTAPAQR